MNSKVNYRYQPPKKRLKKFYLSTLHPCRQVHQSISLMLSAKQKRIRSYFYSLWCDFQPSNLRADTNHKAKELVDSRI